MNEICTFYHNIGFSTYVVSQADVLLVILILVITISSFVVLLSAKILKPYTKKSVLSVVSGRLTYVYQLILYKSPHMYKELHKCIFTSRGKWAIIGMILAIIYFSLSDLKYFSDIENYNDKIYLKYGGQNYSEIANIVTEKKNEYILVQEKLIELRKGYESGEVSVIVYAGYADYSKSVAQSMEAMKELDDKIEYLSNLKQESDIDGYLMSDRGYEQIFGKESVVRTVIISIIMLICIMILAFGNVNNEYRAKMNELIISTKLGEKRVYVHKMTVCALVSAFVSIVVCLIELYIMASHYGLPYLSAPIQSLSFMRYVDINVNILQWIIMLIMIKMVAATVVAVILFSLFYIVKRKRA
ncbi:MAG: hypothetical protein IJB96_10720 [Lachnospira sp.]|nr:hypothetical protein [Lachnospira sp.]